MKSWLIAVEVTHDSEPGKGFALSLERTPVTIGARPENDVVLAHPWVSGAHAHVVVSHGALVVHDHSRNGTFVQGRRVQSAPLQAGDTLSIPPFSLAFELVSGDSERLTSTIEAVPVPAPPAQAPPPPAPASGLSLEVHDGPATVKRRRLPLPPKGLTLGRDAEADLVLDLPPISRLHAEVRPRGANGWVVRDLGSSNGTSVNGRRVTEAELRPGDELQLPGGVVLTLVLGDAPPPGLQAPDFLPPPRRRSPDDTADPEPSTVRPGAAAPAGALRLSQHRGGPGDAILVLELAGRVDGYNYTELGQSLDAVVDRGERLVAIDLSRVDFMDHTGLGVLVKSASALEDAGGQLRLCGLSQRLSDSFSLSRLDVFFRGRISGDARSAIQELARRAPR